MRRPDPRRGTTVLEAVVAIAILAISVAAMINLTSQESRSVEMTEDRLSALLALKELKSTFGRRPWPQLSALPADEAAFESNPGELLFEGLHPVFNPATVEDDDEFGQGLKKTFERMQIKRYVLFENLGTLPAGNQYGKVTFRVTYVGRLSDSRKKIENFKIVYE